MNRPIHFRGLNYSGEWRYGSLYIDEDGTPSIMLNGWMRELVRPETVRQYIGIQSEEGIDVYEGDITEDGVIEYFTELHWDSGGSCHPGFFYKSHYSDDPGDLDYHTRLHQPKIMGNVHQNLELLEANAPAV